MGMGHCASVQKKMDFGICMPITISESLTWLKCMIPILLALPTGAQGRALSTSILENECATFFYGMSVPLGDALLPDAASHIFDGSDLIHNPAPSRIYSATFTLLIWFSGYY
jgi:hypothetical protein